MVMSAPVLCCRHHSFPPIGRITQTTFLPPSRACMALHFAFRSSLLWAGGCLIKPGTIFNWSHANVLGQMPAGHVIHNTTGCWSQMQRLAGPRAAVRLNALTLSVGLLAVTACRATGGGQRKSKTRLRCARSPKCRSLFSWQQQRGAAALLPCCSGAVPAARPGGGTAAPARAEGCGGREPHPRAATCAAPTGRTDPQRSVRAAPRWGGG